VTEPIPQPSRKPQRSVDEIAQYLSDLTQAEIALLRQIYGLQLKRGRCFASIDYLGERLNISARQVQNLLWGRSGRGSDGHRRPGLWERGLVSRLRQPGRRLLLRVTDKGRLAIENPAAFVTAEPEGPAVPMSEADYEAAGDAAPVDAGAPLFGEVFNVFAEANPDRLTPPQLWAQAFNAGRFQFMRWGNRPRAILRVGHGHGSCWVELATDAEQPERILFNAERLTQLKFWRQATP
jgi:hypothetical protein